MPVIILKCNRCGYEWPQRGKNKPKRCAGCGTPYYDQPRKNKQRLKDNNIRLDKNA